ncbi:hypothetical protein I3842_03G248700 [Carya illinoinensis]|uniref:Uncharacterized protein n=1 Tax=Carya illinoinensis TaxID=32201 RepID=A0A922FKV2_CARIL|nr:hypothetical protein I3842_03G248700 [Carya illinoinensis]
MAAHTQSSGKRSWPELIGVKGEAAAETIARENSKDGKVDIVKDGMMVTMDFRADRVRVWVDNSGSSCEVASSNWLARMHED